MTYTLTKMQPSDRVGDEGHGKPKAYATVLEHKTWNKHVKQGTSESAFVDMREKRDSTLNEVSAVDIEPV